MGDKGMKHDDQKIGGGRSGEDFGKQSPGRNPRDDRSSGQRDTEPLNKPGMEDEDDDDFGSGQLGRRAGGWLTINDF